MYDLAWTFSLHYICARHVSKRQGASDEISNIEYLHIDVYLGAWVELGEDGGFESLFQVKTHLAGLAIAMRASLPLRRAECGHAVLTVNDRAVVEGFTPGPSNLKQEQVKGAQSGTVVINTRPEARAVTNSWQLCAMRSQWRVHSLKDKG